METNGALGTKSVYARLREKGFVDDEISEALENLLFLEEKEFLNYLYPLGLDSDTTIYQFALLNDPALSNCCFEYWSLAQKILVASSDVLANYYFDERNDVHGINGKSIPDYEKERIFSILYLNQLCNKYKRYYHNISPKFNYQRAQTILSNTMRKILGERALAKIQIRHLDFAPEKAKDAKRLDKMILFISNMIKDCRQGKEIFRFDSKTGVKYIKRYNKEPFIAARQRRSFALEKTRAYLVQKKPFPINSSTTVLFRQLILDSSFMRFIRYRGSHFQNDEGLNSYQLFQIWVDRDNRSLMRLVDKDGISLETMQGHLKESISEVIKDYESTKLRMYLQNYTPHRPETIRYLANRVKPMKYNASSYQESGIVHSFDKMFILLNAVDLKMWEQLPLPYLEREFVILKFGLRGKYYSCNTISKMLHADLNLIQNYYAKYLRLIFKAMERYAHAYIDMEAEQKVVLK